MGVNPLTARCGGAWHPHSADWETEASQKAWWHHLGAAVVRFPYSILGRV